MPKLQNVEDVDEVIVGRRYLVNTVRTLKQTVWGGTLTPILGGLHEDREVIGFRPDHIHVDWRFVWHARFEFIQRSMGDRRLVRPFSLLGLPLSIGMAISEHYRTGEMQPERRDMECKRVFDVFPESAPWMAELERHYRNARACKNVCPHRGISLVGAPEDDRGARVCPGHGLSWDKKTGALRPRALFTDDMKRAVIEGPPAVPASRLDL